MLVRDDGNQLHINKISDPQGIYAQLLFHQASVVDIWQDPGEMLVLRDISVLSFCKDYGESQCTAEDAIASILKSDPRSLLIQMYNDPELNQ